MGRESTVNVSLMRMERKRKILLHRYVPVSIRKWTSCAVLERYVISDVWSRYRITAGLLHHSSMGWDAFGLPAENYAIKMGRSPESQQLPILRISNVRSMKSQLSDWDKKSTQQMELQVDTVIL